MTTELSAIWVTILYDPTTLSNSNSNSVEESTGLSLSQDFIFLDFVRIRKITQDNIDNQFFSILVFFFFLFYNNVYTKKKIN